MALIDVPGHGTVEFPDSMSNAQIEAAIQQNMVATPSHVTPEFIKQSFKTAWQAEHPILTGIADVSAGMTDMTRNVLNKISPAEPTLSSLVTGNKGGGLGDKLFPQGATHPDSGFRTAGQLLDPTALAIGAKGYQLATTIPKLAAQPFKQAVVGGAGSGMVLGAANAPEGDTVTGGAIGATVGGTLGGIGERAVTYLANTNVGRSLIRGLFPENPVTKTARINTEVDASLAKAFKDSGIDPADIDPAEISTIRQQVIDAAFGGKELDAAAKLRERDFGKLGMQGTQGQLTRDPTQYAQEINLRGNSIDLAGRFKTQNTQLQDMMAGYGSDAEHQTVGTNMAASLLRTDEGMRNNVSALYQAARKSAGKDLDVPLQGVAQDIADMSSRYSETVMKSLPLDAFKQYGLFGGKQTKVFTIEDADQLLKNINTHVGKDAAVNLALKEMRDAVKQAVYDVDATGGPFAPAVKAAQERFKLQDAVPALKAVSRGNAEPDTLVQQYIIGGKTADVQQLAKLLQRTDPDQFNAAREQMGNHLKRAAYGENVAGDAPFSPERYAKALRTFGKDKLAAFFSPEEIEQLNTMSRVGSYINKHPASSPVNTSNTFVSAAMNNPIISGIAGQIPMGQAMLAAGRFATGGIKNEMAVSQAMNPNVVAKPFALTAEQARNSAMLNVLPPLTGAMVGGNQPRR